MQTTLEDHWELNTHYKSLSKKAKFPYKILLGKSLSKYIHECRAEGLETTQIIAKVLREDEIKSFLLMMPEQKERLLDLLKNSVSARICERESSEGVYN